ncbi:MAG: peptidylprolyl isomerase [Myxococcales bacterium]|nr:peptidylprolyl isomerase [Myxococcales bacterium]
MRTSRPLRVALLAGALGCDAVGAPAPMPPEVPDLVAENRAAGDPYGGRFPLSEAVAGLPEGSRLRAEITTDAGVIHCTLDLDAPLTVANFVGLARGLRPFREGDAWIKAPYYDGAVWHRTIEGQFVQGGQRGQGGPGYRLQDEISPGAKFDRAGLLAMANKGLADSAGAEFYITTAAMPDHTGHYTIFGACDDEFVVRDLQRQVAGGARPKITSIRITR